MNLKSTNQPSALARQLRRIGRVWRAPIGTTNAEPSAYEQVTRSGLDALAKQVDRLELKINGVFLTLLGAVLAEIYRAVVR